MLPGLLSFAKLDIVGGTVRKADGGKLMFNQCPWPSRVAWVGGVLKGWCLPHQASTVTRLSQGTSLLCWACLSHLYYARTFPQDLKTMHTPKMENLSIFMLVSILNMVG